MKRLLILGFVFVLLLAIPLTLFLLGQQTKIRSGASPATRLTFVPSSKDVNVGEGFSLDLSLDPGVQSGNPNVISFINLQITYPTNLALDTTQGDNGSGLAIHKVNGKSLVILVPLSSPQCGASTCIITISLGVNPGEQIQTIAPSFVTLYFKANGPSDSGNNEIRLDNTKVLSTGQSDQPSNNVLSSPGTAEINVTAPSTTPSPTITDSPTPPEGAPTATDTPVQGGGVPPTATIEPTVTGGITGTITPTVGSGVAPTCTSLTVDKLNGPAPLAVNFTTTGNDANGSVSKITYNFGDGKVQDVTTGGGIGTTVVNSQVAHTYDTDGTFTASVSITDTGGGVSDPGSCTKTITVGAGGTATPSASIATATPPIPSSGPGHTIVNVGIIGGILSILGAILIFAL